MPVADALAAVLSGADALPDTVHAALAARIDLLPADEKRVLQTAAVVGRVFWPAAIAEIATLEPTHPVPTIPMRVRSGMGSVYVACRPAHVGG